MSKLITEEQKREIESLTGEHCGALIAYGADMYRQGIYKGLIVAGVGLCVGKAISYGVKTVKKRKADNETEE